MSASIKKITDRLNIKKKDVLPLVVSLLLVLVIFFTGKIFNFNLLAFTPLLFVVVFSALCIFLWIFAGLAVFKSLAVINASLSLMIFIAQAYCNLPEAARTADASLQSLIGFGLLCIVVAFFKSLYTEMINSLEKFKEINGGKKSYTLIIFFSIFVGLFLLQLYQVIAPILHGLCIPVSL